MKIGCKNYNTDGRVWSLFHKLWYKFYILSEDLEEALIAILYPRKNKNENKDDAEQKEDLVDSLKKLILGKFDEKRDEFYKWSQTIHDEVGSVMKKI